MYQLQALDLLKLYFCNHALLAGNFSMQYQECSYKNNITKLHQVQVLIVRPLPELWHSRRALLQNPSR